MQQSSTPESSNGYCARLRLPAPDLKAAAARHDIKLVHLMALALLEAGGPLPLDAIVGRLGRLPLPPRLSAPDLGAALLKSWRGQPPVVRDPVDGLFYLDLLAADQVWRLSFVTGGLWLSASPEPALEYQPPPDSAPLSKEEVDAAFGHRVIDNYSSIRRAAAILEAAGGGPLPVDEIRDRLKALSPHPGRMDEQTAASWRSDLVLIQPDGRLRVNPASGDLPAFRRDVRRMALVALRQKYQSQAFKARHAEWSRQKGEIDRAELDEARRARRALLHLVTIDGAPRAAAMVDAGARTTRMFTGDQLQDLPAVLAGFDLLAGVDLRPSLKRLGLDPDRWWLAELRPAQRTFRPGGRAAIDVTMPALVQATTGARGAPAAAADWEGLLAKRSTGQIEKRLAQEAAALFGLYQYGALHGAVRVRTRPGDERLPVAWSLPGDAGFHQIVASAIHAWAPVQMVVGPPPPLADPWASAATASIVERDHGRLFVRGHAGLRVVEEADIGAIRIVGPAEAAQVRPGFGRHHDKRTCRLTAALDGIAPPIWRTLEVPASLTLDRLHLALQAAFGWTNSHLHMFEIGQERVSVPCSIADLDEGGITRSGRIVQLGQVVDRGHRRFSYEYDFGDSWRHTVTVEDIRESDEAWMVRCVDGARACPPEDCGGVPGYERLLEILFDPRHAEFEEMRSWVGGRFQPERFDLHEVNAAIRTALW